MSYNQSNFIRYPLDIIEMIDDIEPLKSLLDQYGYKYAYIGAHNLYSQGMMYAEDVDLVDSYYYETLILQRMSEREYEILLTDSEDYGKNMMTLTKKYFADQEYTDYSDLYFDLVKLGIKIDQGEYIPLPNHESNQAIVDELFYRMKLLEYDYDVEFNHYQEQLDFIIAERATLINMYLEGYDVVPSIRSSLFYSE